jgi:hypothetical protein
MQTKLERGKAAFHIRSTILAGAPLIAALALCAPDQALAACGAVSHPAGVHATAGAGGGVHATTGIAAPSRVGGGGGTLGCANGGSAAALHGLPVASSGRVVEATGAHAVRSETHARAATTRTTNFSAHLHAVRPAHHA